MIVYDHLAFRKQTISAESPFLPCFVQISRVRTEAMQSCSLCRGPQTGGTGAGDPAGFRDLVRSPQIHRQMYKRTQRRVDNHRPRPPSAAVMGLSLSLPSLCLFGLSLGNLSHHPTVESVESLADPRFRGGSYLSVIVPGSNEAESYILPPWPPPARALQDPSLPCCCCCTALYCHLLRTQPG